jgi:hypothetical protein
VEADIHIRVEVARIPADRLVADNTLRVVEVAQHTPVGRPVADNTLRVEVVVEVEEVVACRLPDLRTVYCFRRSSVCRN